MNKLQPIVGVGLLLVKDGKVLLGKRVHKNKHGFGEYGGPGGKMEVGETYEQTVIRELAEEAGTEIKIKNLRFLCLSNIRNYPPDQYVDIGFVAEWASGQPQQTEPHKIGPWQWYDINNLPTPLFCAEPNYIEALKTGKAYFTD